MIFIKNRQQSCGFYCRSLCHQQYIAVKGSAGRNPGVLIGNTPHGNSSYYGNINSIVPACMSSCNAYSKFCCCRRNGSNYSLSILIRTGGWKQQCICPKLRVTIQPSTICLLVLIFSKWRYLPTNNLRIKKAINSNNQNKCS